MIDLLLARGADVHAATNDGRTALAYCAQRLGIEHAELRGSDAGADADAASSAALVVVDRLLAAGARTMGRLRSVGFSAYDFATYGADGDARPSALARRLVTAAAAEGPAAVAAIDESRRIGALHRALRHRLQPAHTRGAELVNAAVARGEDGNGRAAIEQFRLVATELTAEFAGVARGTMLDAETVRTNPLARTWAGIEARALPAVLTRTWRRAADVTAEELGQLRLLFADAAADVHCAAPAATLLCRAPRGFGGQSAGYVARGSHQVYLQNVQNPLQLTYACAIPGAEALDAIAALQRDVVELGAGSGYWGALLRARGVDVVLYDRDPPTEAGANAFFASQFAAVEKGGAEMAAVHSARALLLVWPFSEEQWETTVVDGGKRSCEHGWDEAALLAYEGDTIVHVGVLGEEPGCVVTTSWGAKKELRRAWRLERSVAVPQWAGNDDCLTIWRRR